MYATLGRNVRQPPEGPELENPKYPKCVALFKNFVAKGSPRYVNLGHKITTDLTALYEGDPDEQGFRAPLLAPTAFDAALTAVARLSYGTLNNYFRYVADLIVRVEGAEGGRTDEERATLKRLRDRYAPTLSRAPSGRYRALTYAIDGKPLLLLTARLSTPVSETAWKELADQQLPGSGSGYAEGSWAVIDSELTITGPSSAKGTLEDALKAMGVSGLTVKRVGAHAFQDLIDPDGKKSREKTESRKIDSSLKEDAESATSAGGLSRTWVLMCSSGAKTTGLKTVAEAVADMDKAKSKLTSRVGIDVKPMITGAEKFLAADTSAPYIERMNRHARHWCLWYALPGDEAGELWVYGGSAFPGADVKAGKKPTAGTNWLRLYKKL